MLSGKAANTTQPGYNSRSTTLEGTHSRALTHDLPHSGEHTNHDTTDAIPMLNDCHSTLYKHVQRHCIRFYWAIGCYEWSWVAYYQANFPFCSLYTFTIGNQRISVKVHLTTTSTWSVTSAHKYCTLMPNIVINLIYICIRKY